MINNKKTQQPEEHTYVQFNVELHNTRLGTTEN